MGNCRSCEATTSKLFLQDGRLLEFKVPVTVSEVVCMKKMNPKLHFICNADEIDFNAVVKGLPSSAILELGEFYFALPVSVLKRPLEPQEIAQLAVKANMALTEYNKCGCRKELVFP